MRNADVGMTHQHLRPGRVDTHGARPGRLRDALRGLCGRPGIDIPETVYYSPGPQRSLMSEDICPKSANRCPIIGRAPFWGHGTRPDSRSWPLGPARDDPRNIREPRDRRAWRCSSRSPPGCAGLLAFPRPCLNRNGPDRYFSSPSSTGKCRRALNAPIRAAAGPVAPRPPRPHPEPQHRAGLRHPAQRRTRPLRRLPQQDPLGRPPRLGLCPGRIPEGRAPRPCLCPRRAGGRLDHGRRDSSSASPHALGPTRRSSVCPGPRTGTTGAGCLALALRRGEAFFRPKSNPAFAYRNTMLVAGPSGRGVPADGSWDIINRRYNEAEAGAPAVSPASSAATTPDSSGRLLERIEDWARAHGWPR